MKLTYQFFSLINCFVIFTILFGCVSKKAVSSSDPKNCLEAKTKWDLWRVETCLRGANIWQKKTDPQVDEDGFGTDPIGPPYLQSDFQSLSSLGANYVNISHPGLLTEQEPYQIDQDAVKNLDNLLEKIEKANMYAVISFRTGPGRNEESFSDGNPKANNNIWKNSDAQIAWAYMWKFVASRYRNNAIVVGYDIMVEPNSNAVLLKIGDPTEFYAKYRGTTYDFGTLAKATTEAIRDVDLDTPILLGVMDWSSVSWLEHTQLSQDTKTVYVVHNYAPYEYTHQYPPLKITYPGKLNKREIINYAWLAKVLKPIADFKRKYNVPVVVNEFGVMRWEKGAALYLDDHMNILEDMGINHAYWLWESSWKGITYDQFDFRKGPSAKNHKNLADTELNRMIKKNWLRNLVRPRKP